MFGWYLRAVWRLQAPKTDQKWWTRTWRIKWHGATWFLIDFWLIFHDVYQIVGRCLELILQDLGWERNQRMTESKISWVLLGNDLEVSIYGGLRINSSGFRCGKVSKNKRFLGLFWETIWKYRFMAASELILQDLGGERNQRIKESIIFGDLNLMVRSFCCPSWAHLGPLRGLLGASWGLLGAPKRL